MKSESSLTRELMDYLKTQGAFILVLAGGSSLQTRGLPDRVMAHKDLPNAVFLEFKKIGNDLSKIQRWLFEEMNRRNNGTVFKITFVDDERIKINDSVMNYRKETLLQGLIEHVQLCK